jgi:putative chitinase
VDTAEEALPHVLETFQRFDISTPARKAAFLAQVGHESGLKPIEENLNYSRQALLNVFPKYFTEDTVDLYTRKPEAIANRVYGGRMGNGNEATGDGWTYRGRGWIQCTGRGLYQTLSRVLEVDLVGAPDLLLDPKFSALAAGWFWKDRGLNELADQGNFELITKRINGGLNGYAHRLDLWANAKQVLGVA